jgi:sugar transferase EpsL
MLKRIFDIAISLIGLIITLPIILIVGVLILLIDGRPVIYRQLRVGGKRKLFTFIKFRTMLPHSISIADNSQITRLGKILRNTSLDELPNLWNVLRGEMSIVGPRPLLIEYLEYYSLDEMRRHDVLPGITGWAQVNGRNSISWDEKLMLDVWYVDNQSLVLDLRIILLTFQKVLNREGINQSEVFTMEKLSEYRKNNNS